MQKKKEEIQRTGRGTRCMIRNECNDQNFFNFIGALSKDYTVQSKNYYKILILKS